MGAPAPSRVSLIMVFSYDPKELKKLEKVFGQLKDQDRMKIVLLLKKHPMPMCVNEIAAALQIEETVCSFHLRTLASVQILIAQTQGPVSYYLYNLVAARTIAASLCGLLLPEPTKENAAQTNSVSPALPCERRRESLDTNPVARTLPPSPVRDDGVILGAVAGGVLGGLFFFALGWLAHVVFGFGTFGSGSIATALALFASPKIWNSTIVVPVAIAVAILMTSLCIAEG